MKEYFRLVHINQCLDEEKKRQTANANTTHAPQKIFINKPSPIPLQRRGSRSSGKKKRTRSMKRSQSWPMTLENTRTIQELFGHHPGGGARLTTAKSDITGSSFRSSPSLSSVSLSASSSSSSSSLSSSSSSSWSWSSSSSSSFYICLCVKHW